MRSFLSGFLAVLTVIYMTFVTVVLFFRETSEMMALPDIAGLDGALISDLLSSLPVLIILAAVVVLLLFALGFITGINKAFLAFGIVFSAEWLVDLILMLSAPRLVKALPDGMDTIISRSNGAFSDYLLLCILSLIILSTISFSVYASMREVRRKSYE